MKALAPSLLNSTAKNWKAAPYGSTRPANATLAGLVVVALLADHLVVAQAEAVVALVVRGLVVVAIKAEVLPVAVHRGRPLAVVVAASVRRALLAAASLVAAVAQAAVASQTIKRAPVEKTVTKPRVGMAAVEAVQKIVARVVATKTIPTTSPMRAAQLRRNSVVT